MVAKAMGFPKWNGYSLFEPNNEVKFLHRSQPWERSQLARSRGQTDLGCPKVQ